MTKIVPLTVEEHADLKIMPTADFSHLKDQHILPLVVHEFVSVSSDLPVVFVKVGENEQLVPMAMCGLKPGDNLVVGEDGRWMTAYIPGIVTTYPLRVIPAGENRDQLALAIDEESSWVSREEGDALFNADGSHTEYLEKRQDALSKYYEHNQITGGFVSMMNDLGLIEERNLSVEVGGDQININGLFVISEDKLNELPAETFEDLRKRGFLPAIYAQMISINQIRRLGKFKMDRDGSAA